MMDVKRLGKFNGLLVLPMLLAFITVLIMAFGGSWLTSSSVQKISYLNDGWSISRDRGVIENVSLKDYLIRTSKKGERITISNKIYLENDDTTIMFRSNLAAVDVSIDGVKVYSYGKQYTDKGQFIPKKYNFITFNDLTGVHDLSITYTLAEMDSLRKIAPIYYGAKRDLIRSFYGYHRTSVFVGAFLIVYSFLLFSLWLFLYLSNRKTFSIFMSAVFSNLLGCYIYAYNDIFCFITEHDMLFTVVEYTAFYLLPLAFSILLYSIHPTIATKQQHIVIATNIITPLIIIALHFTRVVYLCIFSDVVGFICVVEILVMLPALIKGLIDQKKERIISEYYLGIDADFYLLAGFVVLTVFLFMQIGIVSIFRMEDNFVKADTLTSYHFLEHGMLFFMICLFIYYFLYSIDDITANRVKSQLEGLAYTDALTGLANRARISQVYASLSGDYAVVSLDLDRLKKVNDTLGHIEGDKMIKAFADILAESFDSADLIGRNGGDEFIVIFKNPAKEILEKCVRTMDEKMAAFNKEEHTFTLSASVGYAFSKEVGTKRYQDVFYLADQRMYKMKEVHHE
jgi:diguanylate cyclase (GGDEF)-like protein